MISLGAQLNNFKNVEKRLRSELGDSEAKRIISRAVYLFHLGGNDYVYPILFANSSTFKSSSKEKFSDFVLGNITAVIEVKIISKFISNCFLVFIISRLWTPIISRLKSHHIILRIRIEPP